MGQGTYRLILLGVTQPRRGHIREGQAATKPHARAQLPSCSKTSHESPPLSSKEETFPVTSSFRICKNTPQCPFHHLTRHLKAAEVPDAALPWASQPQQLQLHFALLQGQNQISAISRSSSLEGLLCHLIIAGPSWSPGLHLSKDLKLSCTHTLRYMLSPSYFSPPSCFQLN